MASIIAKRYGRALFDLAEEKGQRTQVGEQLAALKALWANQPELKEMLQLPAMPKADKKRVMASLLEGEGAEPVTGLVSLLIDKGRILYLPEIADEYEELRLAAERIVRAKVSSVRELTPEQTARIQASLEKALKQHVVLSQETDPGLIGGLVVRVGDQIFDNSLRTRLQNMKKDLLQNKSSQEVAR